MRPYLLVAPLEHGEDHPVEIQDAPAEDVEPFLRLFPAELGENELLPGKGREGMDWDELLRAGDGLG